MKAGSLFTIIFFLLLTGTLFAQQETIDSLNTALRISKNDSDRAKAYIALSDNYAYIKLDTMPVFCNKALGVINKHKGQNAKDIARFNVFKAQALNNLGYYHYATDDNPKAMEHYNAALEAAMQSGDSVEVGGVLVNRGIIFRKDGRLPEALDDYLRSLAILEAAKDSLPLTSLYNNIGRVYDGMGDTVNALAYILKCVPIQEALGDERGLANTLTNIGIIYDKRRKHREAIPYFEKSLALCRRTGDVEQEALNLTQVGNSSFASGEREVAFRAYARAVAIYDSIHYRYGLTSVLQNQGAAYLQTGDLEKAEMATRRALEIAQQLNYPENIYNAAIQLYRIYKKQGRIPEALEMLELHDRKRDSVLDDRTKKMMYKKHAQYEYDKKMALAEADREKEKLAHDEKSKRQQLIIIAAGAGLLLVVVFSAFLFNRFRITKKQKRIIEEQKHMVDEKNKEILDSIHYAQRIQGALMASDQLLRKNLPEFFVLYRPKDIVSGDFYWAAKVGRTEPGENNSGLFLLAACDCTGHGVPGAFMSLLNISLLNEAVTEKKILQPDLVLGNVRASIIASLNPEGTETESKDGMDSVLCAFDFEKGTLQFACANNPLWLVRDGKLTEYRPDKMPVGMHHGELKPFTLHTTALQKNDVVYLLTDGFADQFGGAQGKKFRYRRLQEMLLEIASLPMDEQKKKLDRVFEDWRGNLEQLDDVLVIGVRV